jgi:hypothetical protein
MAKNKCNHPTCNCMVDEGKQFCSDACRDLANTQGRQLRCDCGHDGCSAKM